MPNTVVLKTIGDLCKENYSFSIPDFQRGYKWTSRQVEDLLNDLEEFVSNKSKDEFYCLQPLVVVPSIVDKENNNWSVIDGQQRLTTIFMILSFLNYDTIFSISYQTRKDSADYLGYFKNFEVNKIDIEAQKEYNTDYYHIYNTYKTVKKWFINKPQTDLVCLKCKFRNTLLNRTKFIWYECNEDNVVEVFTRINIGKIGLTNAELIKALMLNSSNWQDKNSVESEQYHIAEEWNRMEITLQNDEFWYFLCNKSDIYSTRIELLFDVICKNNRLNKDNNASSIGNDQYRTFRYFYNYFKSKDATLIECWGEVRRLFQVLTEWYKDVECYHYIGFLIECKKENNAVKDWYETWCSSKGKNKFKKELKNEVKKFINFNKEEDIDTLLNQQYEIRVGNKKEISKTVCRPILLLHNIQLVIKQNKKDEKDIFQENVFYRFPFYLLKINNWDVEHIDSNTTNNLSDNYARLLWLLQYEKEEWLSESLQNELIELLGDIKMHLKKNKTNESSASDNDNDICNEEEDNLIEEDDNDADSSQEVEETTSIEKLESQIKLPVSNEYNVDEEEIRQKMKSFVFEKDGTNRFDEIVSKIESEYEASVQKNNKRLNRFDKNKIWNFTLLDSKTNRSYGNSIFPRKRRTIMARDMGKECMLKFENGEFVFEMVDTAKSAFIPPVTRNVFMKYYTPNAADFSLWNKDDAEAYKNDIKNMLSDFLS